MIDGWLSLSLSRAPRKGAARARLRSATSAWTTPSERSPRSRWPGTFSVSLSLVRTFSVARLLSRSFPIWPLATFVAALSLFLPLAGRRDRPGRLDPCLFFEVAAGGPGRALLRGIHAHFKTA